MKRILVSIVSVGVLAGASQAGVLTRFDFNSATPDANTATGRITPSVGAGTASLLGVTGTFASGDANLGSSDPATGDDSGWQTTGYTAQGAGDKTRGTQYLVSTLGQKDIVVKYDLRHSNTSSRYEQFQYTLNGTTWVDSTVFDGNAGDTWFNGRTVNLSAIAGASNNANFGFRIVSTFAPGTSSYAASNSASSYATTGTWRFDYVTVESNPVPEPASMLALGLGVTAMIRRRVRK